MVPGTLSDDACRKCRHFWVTWRPGYPFGCRAFQMVTRQLPLGHVRQQSGEECLYYEEKPKPLPPGGTGNGKSGAGQGGGWWA